jgi:MarR family transcriptional regulator, organic hydroperoxide resistance regulator
MTIPQLQAARRHGLSTSAILAMLILHRDKHTYMTRLSKGIGTTSANITGLADFLVKKGLASQRRDENDRRSIIISLTEKGTALVEEMTEPEFQPI